MTGEQVLFAGISVVTVVSALLMVYARHPVYSAVFMILSMFGLAGAFVLLDSFFLGVIQVLVYAGAIMVLFLFIIMLLNVDQESTYLPTLSIPGVGLVATFLGFVGGMLFNMIQQASRVFPTAADAQWILTGGEGGTSIFSVSNLAGQLFYRHWFPFEAISMLLLSAIVGVVVLSKRRLA